MNYRHAFHAGNHADVLKHVVLLAVCDALGTKPAAMFALDTHAGAGLYALGGEEAGRTGEAEGGIVRLTSRSTETSAQEPALRRYLDAVAACRAEHGEDIYPGSPWLLAHALRAQDRIACCELRSEEAERLRASVGADPRVAVHARDGYAAIDALLPPKADGARIGRGLVLIDPPYETQLAEFDTAVAAIRRGLTRWPQACWMLWYPIKRRSALQPFYRAAAALEAKSALRCELLVRPDDSPLRMNGSGMLLLNAPWRIEDRLRPALDALCAMLGEHGATTGLDWLRPPD